MALTRKLSREEEVPWAVCCFLATGASILPRIYQQFSNYGTSPSGQKEGEAEMEQVQALLICWTSKLNSVAASIAGTRIKYGWLIILAVLLQRMPFAVSVPSSFVELKKALLVLSYVLLLWALSHNLHLWSVRIVALGAILNFAAIVANGGLMPVSLAARLQAGMTAIGQSGFGKVLPEGTGILLPVDQTNLWFLSDIIPISSVGGVFSPGDVLIGVGLLLFLVEAARWGNTSSQKRGAGYLLCGKCWSVSQNK